MLLLWRKERWDIQSPVNCSLQRWTEHLPWASLPYLFAGKISFKSSNLSRTPSPQHRKYHPQSYIQECDVRWARNSRTLGFCCLRVTVRKLTAGRKADLLSLPCPHSLGTQDCLWNTKKIRKFQSTKSWSVISASSWSRLAVLLSIPWQLPCSQSDFF